MKTRKVRYAVVALGHISQVAVLPAFAHAANSELAALVSDDPDKLRILARRYEVPVVASYDDLEAAIAEGEVDAVYIALPNHLHREYAVRAAKAGAHVLCEKPMAVTESDCVKMMDAADENGVKLMIAYRLHFDPANLRAMELVKRGDIGRPRIVEASLTLQVEDSENIRLNPRVLGGGPLYDLGIYCVNASRYLLRSEPVEAVAVVASREERRYRKVEEMMMGTLRFPGACLASFTCSVGSADTSDFRIVGTEGEIRLEGAFDYVEPRTLYVTRGEKTTEESFPKRDQFAAELIYFSDCILNRRTPEPSGLEGLADVRIINELYRSADARKVVRLEPLAHRRRPSKRQAISRPPVKKPRMVEAGSPRQSG
jgi:predicted dehydrogenase